MPFWQEIKTQNGEDKHAKGRVGKPNCGNENARASARGILVPIGQILPSNPAGSVRGPKYVLKKGKTPVLTRDEAESLLESIPAESVVGLRDRALIALMDYSFARIGAALALNVEDYHQQGKRWRLRLHERGGKDHSVPAHHKLDEYLGRLPQRWPDRGRQRHPTLPPARPQAAVDLHPTDSPRGTGGSEEAGHRRRSGRPGVQPQFPRHPDHGIP